MGERILCGYLLLHQHSEHRAVPSARHIYFAALLSLVLLLSYVRWPEMEEQPLKVKILPVFEQSASQTNSWLGCSLQQQGPILGVCLRVCKHDRPAAAREERGCKEKAGRGVPGPLITVKNTRIIYCFLIFCFASLLTCGVLLCRKQKPHWLQLNWDFTPDFIILFSHRLLLH